MSYWHTILHLIEGCFIAATAYIVWRYADTAWGLFRNHRDAWLVLNGKVEGILNAKGKDDTTH